MAAFRWKTLLEPQWLLVEVLGLAAASLAVFEYEKFQAADKARRHKAWRCVVEQYFVLDPYQPDPTWAAANGVALPVYLYGPVNQNGIDAGQFVLCGYTPKEAAALAKVFTGPNYQMGSTDTWQAHLWVSFVKALASA